MREIIAPKSYQKLTLDSNGTRGAVEPVKRTEIQMVVLTGLVVY